MDKDYFSIYELVVKFMLKNEVTCYEDIWQSDRVTENTCDFVNDLFDAVKHDERIKATIERA